MISCIIFLFFFNDTATTEIYTLSLHDALPISPSSPSCSGRPPRWAWPRWSCTRSSPPGASTSAPATPRSGTCTRRPVSRTSPCAGSCERLPAGARRRPRPGSHPEPAKGGEDEVLPRWGQGVLPGAVPARRDTSCQTLGVDSSQCEDRGTGPGPRPTSSATRTAPPGLPRRSPAGAPDGWASTTREERRTTVSNDSFVHLHVHTEYSMLDGAAKLPEVTRAAAEQGMPALAMTDHGNVFGAYDFYKQTKAAGVKPIIGMEGYYTPGSRFDRAPFDFGDNLIDEEGDGGSNRGKAAYTHMTLLARTTEGMPNPFRISSLASLGGQYRKPRFDPDLLEPYGTGLLAPTGCPSGEVNMWLRAGKEDKARQAAADFQDIFGRENFYAELMDHGLSIEKKTRPALMAIAKDLGIPLLATNDLHYTHKEDAQAHDALLCIQTGSRLNETNRFKFNGDGYYLKSAAEMRALFPGDLREACDNTLLIAEQCEVTFTEGADLMPRFPLPEGEDETSWFIKEVERGLHKRYPGGIPDHVRKQADYETGIICQMGFPGYFLVVADFINWAKDNGIRVGPGRGSAAGSLAAYAMGITDLDPLAHGLIFERFLNPEHVSMPDVDIDFDDRRRGEVIRYVSQKYGEERVSQIVTYGTIKAKAAIKDAARVLDRPYSVGDELTKLMPPDVMGKGIPLTGVFDPAHPRYKEAAEFRARYESDPGAAEVVDQARKLEGLKRQWGVHAAGVIIGRHPLIDSIPIMRREADGAIITQFDYPTCETLGLLKMDFLGLRNLTVIDDALRNIVINGKEPVDVDEISKDLTDPATYELLSRGETLGVFQFDRGPIPFLLRLMRSDTTQPIPAFAALCRPASMRANSRTNYALP